MRYNSVKDAKQQTTQLISGKEQGKDVICRVIKSIDPTGQYQESCPGQSLVIEKTSDRFPGNYNAYIIRGVWIET